MSPIGYRRFRLCVLIGLSALLLVLMPIGIWLYRVTQVAMPEWYAAWEVGDLIVESIEINDGRWPQGWDDLRAAAASRSNRGETAHQAFERLPRRVKVDWSVDPEALVRKVMQEGEGSIQVVTRPDGKPLEAGWGLGTEPNWKIVQYLIEQRRPRTESFPSWPTTAPDTASRPSVDR